MTAISHCHKAKIKEESDVVNGTLLVSLVCTKCDNPCNVSHGGLKDEEVKAFEKLKP